MFAILFEVLLIEIKEEIHHFVGWEGGLRGTKIVNKNFVNKQAFSAKKNLYKISRTSSTISVGIWAFLKPKMCRKEFGDENSGRPWG